MRKLMLMLSLALLPMAVFAGDVVRQFRDLLGMGGKPLCRMGLISWWCVDVAVRTPA